LGNLEKSLECLESANEKAKLHEIKSYTLSTSIKLCNIFKDMAYQNGKVTFESIKYLDKA